MTVMREEWEYARSPPMPALTQCWYTRTHIPVSRKHKEEDGSYTSECRYCGKAISSWAKGRWSLADGFNVSRLRDTTGGRYLYVMDVIDDFVVARYPIDHLETPAAIRACREDLCARHGLNEPGCTLELRDSKDEARLH
jgi:hypothetical protein